MKNGARPSNLPKKYMLEKYYKNKAFTNIYKSIWIGVIFQVTISYANDYFYCTVYGFSTLRHQLLVVTEMSFACSTG